MKLTNMKRPSALPAALTQVVTAQTRSAALAAHVSVVGQSAVRIRSANGTPQLRVRTQASALLTAGGFAGKDIDRGQYVMAGVSGVPPRGRPV